jgi:methylated-DNA-[protein]-cysteine S-methyltransferase
VRLFAIIRGMSTLRIITTSTPDGDFYMIADDDDVVRASGFGDVDSLAARLPEALRGIPLQAAKAHPYQQLVQAYYGGDKQALDRIVRHQDGSDFQEKVWEAISSVGYGSTVSYKELADRSGAPAAIRAAGTICGRNRLILLVPCHRILKSDGSVGSYLYGPAIKMQLLQREKAAI